MREIRICPLSGDAAVISTERVARPRHLGAGRVLDADPTRCPFCPGREDQTPPSLATVDGPIDAAGTRGWQLRVFPNRYPALAVEGTIDPRRHGPYEVFGGVGAHEVIVETRDHHVPAWHSTERQAAVLRLARDRMRDLSGDSRFAALLWFRNHGPEAGASLGHPHSQIVAMPVVPERLARIADRCRAHAVARGGDLIGDILAFERAERVRIVHEGTHATAFTAYAPRSSFETWVVPHDAVRSGRSRFQDAPDDVIDEVASTVCRVLTAYDRVLAEPAHNTLLIAGLDPVRWHIVLLPRLTAGAGFEMLTGGTLLGMAPEEAARLLVGG